MTRVIYRYRFDEGVSLCEVRDSLMLAVLSAEGVHGQASVRLDAGFFVDEKKRACVVDASTPVGQTVAEIFTGLLIRQLDETAFKVERVTQPPALQGNTRERKRSER